MIGFGFGVGLTSQPAGEKSVPDRKVTLIDGNFLKRLCQDFQKKVDFDFFKELDWKVISRGSARSFYYDSLPAKKDGQSEEEFAAEEKQKIAELDYIRSQKWFHVKDGVSRYRKREKRRIQKGVDILLATDAVQMASAGLADELIIFASDTDYFPIFEVLSQTRCRGVLRYEYGKTSDDLTLAADDAYPITLGEAAYWCGRGLNQTNSIFPGYVDVDALPDVGNLGGSWEANMPFLNFDRSSNKFSLFAFQNRKWVVASHENVDLILWMANALSANTFPVAQLQSFRTSLMLLSNGD